MWVGLVYGNLRAKECIASSSFPCGNLNTVYYSGFIWNYLPASLLDSIFAFPLFFSRLLSFLPTASEGATNQISVQNSAITYLLALPALASFWFCPPYSHGTWDKCMDLHWLMGKHWCAAVAVFSLLHIELCLTPNLGTSCDWIEDARCRPRSQAEKSAGAELGFPAYVRQFSCPQLWALLFTLKTVLQKPWRLKHSGHPKYLSAFVWISSLGLLRMTMIHFLNMEITIAVKM